MSLSHRDIGSSDGFFVPPTSGTKRTRLRRDGDDRHRRLWMTFMIGYRVPARPRDGELPAWHSLLWGAGCGSQVAHRLAREWDAAHPREP